MEKLHDQKIKSRDELKQIIKELKKKGKKIGVTNGVFDILHTGHVDYLGKAKKICDVLIVSLNTDQSIKQYKEPGRPINPQEDRAKVVAALESVDFVTFHPERRMKDALVAFKPDYYIKAGDYKVTELTSRDVLKKWGGETVIIPPVEGKSTTNTIQKIIDTYGNTPISLEIDNKESSKAVFLDRDGVINEDIGYLHEPEKFKFKRGALEGIKKMYDMGFKIVIVTTQAGIGLGYFSKEDFFNVNKVMLKGFFEQGVIISKVYFCPHTVEDNCSCRKPKTGLLEKAGKDLNVDFSKSFMIGDKVSDIEAGNAVGCKTIQIKTKKEKTDLKPDYIASDLIEASETIKKDR